MGLGMAICLGSLEPDSRSPLLVKARYPFRYSLSRKGYRTNGSNARTDGKANDHVSWAEIQGRGLGSSLSALRLSRSKNRKPGGPRGLSHRVSVLDARRVVLSVGYRKRIRSVELKASWSRRWPFQSSNMGTMDCRWIGRPSVRATCSAPLLASRRSCSGTRPVYV